jgi:ABC-type transport system involved in Fe-S cluster assembly fused permease/ATPase subunit
MLRASALNTGHIRAVTRLVWGQASRDVKVRLAIVVVLVVTSSVLTALGPLMLKWIVDHFTGAAPAAGASVFVLVGLYIASQWLGRAVGEIRAWMHTRAQRRLFTALSERLFEHLMRLPLRFHLDRRTGAVSRILENGLQGYQMILHHLVSTVLPLAGELGTVILVLARLDQPVFLWLFCASIVCYGVAFAFAAMSIVAPAQAASAVNVEANARMTDSLLNYETVKYFAAERLVQSEVSAALVRTEQGWVRFARLSARNGLGIATVFAAFLAVSVGYAAREVEAGRMTVGEFVLVNAYMLQVVRPIEMIGLAMQAFSQGLAMLSGMLDLFKQVPEPLLPDREIELRGPTSLEFRDVAVSYQADRPGLRGVSFRVPPGKTLGIVGASGAGKSTIVRLLVRMLEPGSGAILIGGIPVSELPISQLRRLIAVVPQDCVLFNDTIGYNIAFGKPGGSRQDVEEAAELAHLQRFISRLPEGYDTAVGERGVKLSGGEKQRVAIARAAIKRPLIYVFDEATSSLDSQTEKEILHNIRTISRSCTTLIIAHRLSTTVHADEIAVLHDGMVVERGSHVSLLSQRGAYWRLWQAQQEAAEKMQGHA